MNTQAESGKLAHHFDELDVDLRRLLMLLWRRKWVILSFVLVALILSVLITFTLSTKYTAQALIRIQNENINQSSINLENFLSENRLDTALVLSEVEVLRSRRLASGVIDRLGLAGGANNPVPATDNGGSDTAGFKSLTVYKREMDTQESPDMSRDKARAVNAFLSDLTIKSIPGSYVIQISYTDTDPRRAAKVANTLVDVYFEQRLEEKFRATQKVTQWLDKRLATLRDQVRTAEEAVEQYRSQNDLVQGARYEISAQQISELNSQLVLAKSRKAEAEARLKDMQSFANNPTLGEESIDVLNARFIQDLKRTETDLLRQKAELSSRYGPKHPAIQNINEAVANQRAKIREETTKIASSVKNELEVAEERVQAMQRALSEVENVREGENKSMISLRELEREAEATRLLYDNFLNTYKKSDQQEQLESAEAEVLSYAAVPERPSYPNKPLIISLAAAIALFIGITFVLILEKLDNAYRSASQLEGSTGYPCFGLIPIAEGGSKGGIADYILNKPSSAVAESIRTLRMVLNLRAKQDKDARPKVITITSSLPAEGKTTLSSWLGRAAAKSGEKVIIIDCDLRRPNLHRIMRKPNDASLVDYLTGDTTLDKVINKDDPSGAHVIYARTVSNSALDLVSSEKMRKLIASLRQAYDLVILDTPACLAVSDARILANESDFTLYVVEWDKTPREVVTTGVKQFSDFDYENLAFVLSSVDVKRHARYGYGDTAYYYGRFKEYYHNN